MTASLDIASSNGSHHGVSTSDDNANDYIGSTVSLRMLRAAARRRRRTWVLIAIAGLVLGASLRLALPKTYSAVTRLYLTEPSGAPASEGMATDVALLQTPGLATAVAQATPSLKGTKGSFKGLGVTSNIMTITAKESTPAGALTLAKAAAQQFLQRRTAELTKATEAAVAGLQQQIDADVVAAQSLYSSIAKAPQKQQLALFNEWEADGTTIQNLRNAEAQAYKELTTETSANGSYVLDPAALSPSKTKKVTIENALSGLIAGLALGLGIVVVGEIVSDRLRWRADISRALDVPVELSVGRYRRSHLLRAIRMQWRLKRPSKTLIMMERRLRARFQATPGHALATIALEAAEPAALAVASLARSLAADGMRVVVVDLADGRPLAALFGVHRGETVHAIEIGGRAVTLVVSPPDPAQIGLETDPGEVDAVLVLASADPRFGAEHIAAWAREAVVVITAGEVSASRIRGTAQMLRQAGITLQSAILVDTDRADDSVGVVGVGPAYWGGDPALEGLPTGPW